jgi:hypothetical protein
VFVSVAARGKTAVASSANTTAVSANTHMHFPSHMPEGKDMTFRVTVLQALEVSPDYADVFAQFK